MARTFLDVIHIKEDEPKTPQDFKKVVEETLWTIHWWKGGRGLLDAIVAESVSFFTTHLWPINIRFLTGACAFHEVTGGGRFFDFDPQYLYHPPRVFEPTWSTVVNYHKTYIYVYHELIHAYHCLKRQYRQGTNEEEFRTVGLYGFDTRFNERFTENRFRKEIQLPVRRPCYNWMGTELLMRQEEDAIRRRVGLPDIATLNPTSEECKFIGRYANP